jgi:hypothetical protein
MAGGVPGPRVVGGGPKKLNKPSKVLGMNKMTPKQPVSCMFCPKNRRKRRFLPESTFFRNTLIFKKFSNLWRCRVMPVQSFGSHIRRILTTRRHGVNPIITVYKYTPSRIIGDLQKRPELENFHLSVSLRRQSQY